MQDLPGGEGAIWLQVEKTRLNTAHVAAHLAQFLGLPEHEIGHAGLKDRAAVTVQWFSVPSHARHSAIPMGEAINATAWGEYRVLGQHPAPGKLRPGDHDGNRFRLRIRACRGDRSALAARLETIRAEGVPNYFERQRFGQGEENLRRARIWLARRRLPRGRLRGFVVGAARAWVFNHVLAHRVLSDNWNETLAGEPCPEPSGPLWGRGSNPARQETAGTEWRALRDLQAWLDGLERSGSRFDRRPLISRPRDLRWTFESEDCLLAFDLEPGEYATNVLAHCFGDLREARCGGWHL